MMTPPSRDDIAREAARLIEIGREESLGSAVDRAMEILHAQPQDRPSHGRVRRHIQGLALQSMGEEAYQAHVRLMRESAEEVMTVFEEFDPVLVGRAARGQIDGGVTLHIRIYTQRPVEALIDRLEQYGYEGISVDTINTRWGRLNRLVLSEEGHPIIITRCRPDMRGEAGRNLHRDEAITVATLRDVRASIG